MDMHVQNKKSGISSLYPAKLVNYAVLVTGHVYNIWSYKKQKQNTDFFMILTSLCRFNLVIE